MRVGIGVSEDLPAGVQRDLARTVEDAGYASLWTNEAAGRDALLQCREWAYATHHLEVGIGVVPIWSRSPAQLAMAAATLQEATEGRFLLGLGVGHPATAGPWHGASYRRPLTAAREMLDILAILGRGDAADVSGEVFTCQGFAVGITPTPPPAPRYLAAMGPRMLELAGEAADGVLLNWSTPAAVGDAVGTVRQAAAGREVRSAAYVRIAVDPDTRAARAALAREFGRYCALPAYASHFERQGLGEAVTAVKNAFRDGGPAAVAEALDDDVLQVVGWYGSPDDDPGPTLDAYAGAGLDHLVARVVVTGDDAEASVRAVVGALAPPA